VVGRLHSRSVVLLVLTAALLFDGAQANAEPPFVGRCGRVNDFVAATAAAAGSITIGSLKLMLGANDRVPSQVVGMVVCTRRGTLTSGPIVVIHPMTVPLCGRVELIYSPDGRITLMLLQIVDIDPSYRVALQVTAALPAFIAESTDRGVSGCFQFALDARGDVAITSLIGGGSAPPTQGPSTPQVRQLPSTSTVRP
jgi:hypothetical protein